MADEQCEDWKSLYRAAMLETDADKFRERVSKAQKAITARVRELMRDSAATLDERQALADALQDLRLLSKDGPEPGW